MICCTPASAIAMPTYCIEHSSHCSYVHGGSFIRRPSWGGGSVEVQVVMSTVCAALYVSVFCQSTAPGPILSLADQARAKGHFADVEIVDSSSDAEETDGVKPSEVAAMTIRGIRKKRRSFSEGLQPPPMAAVDACRCGCG